MFENIKDVPIPREEYDIEMVRNYQDIKLNDKSERYSEKLVDINEYNIRGINYYNNKNNPPYYHSIPGSISELFLRESVAKKLVLINEKLSSFGVEVFVLDAFRPLAVQNYFYFDWVPNYLKSVYPEKSAEWIVRESNAYWTKGARNKEELMNSIPPHSTGGAVDITLCFKETGHLLEMGTIFDDITERSHTNFFENRKDINNFSFTAIEALKNRRLLFHTMVSEGFASHPKEW
ncbi:MAG: M15 family metallopeptidase [bacterium]